MTPFQQIFSSVSINTLQPTEGNDYLYYLVCYRSFSRYRGHPTPISISQSLFTLPWYTAMVTMRCHNLPHVYPLSKPLSVSLGTLLPRTISYSNYVNKSFQRGYSIWNVNISCLRESLTLTIPDCAYPSWSTNLSQPPLPK